MNARQWPEGFTALIDARTKAYCPACRDRYDDDDMDVRVFLKSHVDAMKARYGAACCFHCNLSHRMSEDGVLLAPGEGVQDSDDAWWSSEEALAEAEDNAANEYFTRRVSKGWM